MALRLSAMTRAFRNYSIALRKMAYFYLVQEYVEGTPLSQELIAGDRWTEKNNHSLLREILEILNFIHQANIIHRDITPSNLIRRKTIVKLFSLILELSEKSAL